MKICKVTSDYSPRTTLCMVQTDDGDISVKIFGKGEFRIATSGGQFHGKRLTEIATKFSELIDLIGDSSLE